MTRRAPSVQEHGRFWRRVRIGALLAVLVVVAATAWQNRWLSTRWREPLFVAIYPIAADASPRTRDYVRSLNSETFKPIDRFFAGEAARYRLRIMQPFRTRLRAELADRPPERSMSDGPLTTMLWSLRLRYWAGKVSRRGSEPEDIRVFVLYHDPELTPTVPHSLGLSKGLIGVVYAFASPVMNGSNAVVIAHEMLHTVGATDKYDAADDAPRFPDGYGDPLQSPLYPQRFAELMAGRRMLTANHWRQAAGLEEVVIGPTTAVEIHWMSNAR